APATQAADVVAILKSVATARQGAIKRLDAAKHASVQASAATDVQHAYAAGVSKRAALPAATSDRAPVRSIEATLSGLAKDYSSLATDARGLRKVRYSDE